MSNMKIARSRALKIVVSTGIFLLLFISIVIRSEAHEFKKPLRWSIVNNTYRVMKVDRAYLSASSIYQNNFSNALLAWHNSPTKAYVIEEPFSTSNASILTPTQNFWNSLSLPSGALALAELTDTNNVSIRTYSGSMNTNGLIKYCSVYVNPNNLTQGLNENAQQTVIVHELGHGYCLWHCTQGTDSIMQPVMYNGIDKIPQQHDIDDMVLFYG